MAALAKGRQRDSENQPSTYSLRPLVFFCSSRKRLRYEDTNNRAATRGEQKERQVHVFRVGVGRKRKSQLHPLAHSMMIPSHPLSIAFPITVDPLLNPLPHLLFPSPLVFIATFVRFPVRADRFGLSSGGNIAYALFLVLCCRILIPTPDPLQVR